jgi:outer membrane cobalamin receptor
MVRAGASAGPGLSGSERVSSKVRAKALMRSACVSALLVAAGAAPGTATGAAWAQATTTTGPDTGETIVVVGQTIEETLPQELEKYGSDLEVVTSEEIRDKVYIDAANAMQMEVPGLFIAPRGGPFSYMDISLQGSRTQDMLFLVDGVRINNRLYSSTITDTLPASMIERIEVLKGGQSLFYGTQAGAGVINVVTRGYTDEFDGRFTVGADSNEGYRADAYVRGKAGPGNFVLYASQDKADGFDAYSDTQPSAFDKNRSYDVKSIGGKYRIDLTDNLAIDARYQHTDAALDYPAASRTIFAQNVRDEDVASIGVDYSPVEWADVLVKGYWHDWDTDYTTIRNNTDPATGAITSVSIVDLGTYWGYEDKGVNALAKLRPHKGIEYVVGYDFQQYSARDDVLLIAEQEEEVHAVFGQIRTTEDMFENAAFAAGLRYNDTGGATATVWNVSGRYDFLPWLYAQAVVGTNFILPTAEQLYAVDPCCTLGSTNLEPEESENLNAGIGGDFEPASGFGFSWQATYFARKIDNLFGSAPFASEAEFLAMYPNLADPDPATPVNELWENGYAINVAGEVEVEGFELTSRASVGDNWGFMATYTHTDSTQQSAAGVTSAIQRIPLDTAKASASYSPASGRWGASLNAIWTGEQNASLQISDGPDAGTTPDTIMFNYGDYVVVDLAAHVFLDADLKHKLTVRLENALDEDYWTRPGSVAPDLISFPGERFVYGNRGVPQTLRVSYSYDF